MKTVAVDSKGISENRRTKFARSAIHRVLQRLAGVQLTIIENGSEKTFGDAEAEVCARIEIHDASLYTAMLSHGSIGAAESYMHGEWSTPDLTSVVRLFVINLQRLNELNSKQTLASKLRDRLFTFVRRNTIGKAKANILEHYDLSNEFFSLFLDPHMVYSSAIYPTADAGLDEAAEYKLAHCCERLQLNETDHLVEIGTGWGGLAIYAAKHYGCKVTTTTISDAQYALAKERIEAAGVADKITLLQQDYRLLEGQYSKLVSIEMIEAVGHQYFAEYFAKCSDLLAPDGLALIQGITIADQRYDQAINNLDFIRRYIFPGGCLPSIAVIAANLRDNTDMLLVGQEDITEHYAKTLRHWRERFFGNIEQVKALGFEDAFIRMWEFYLCYCEGGFTERAIGTSQFLMAKPKFKGLPTVSHG